MDDKPKHYHAALLEAGRIPNSDTGELDENTRQSLLILIEHQRGLFERNGNPLCAWLAYLHAREADVAIPPWVLEYLDRCASGIWELWHDSLSGKKIDHAMIAKALDVVGKRGKGNAFSAYGSPTWMFLAEMVGLYMREGDKVLVSQ